MTTHNVARSASMLDLFEDNGHNPTLAASMLPPLLMTEVKPAAATRGAEGAGLRLVMGRETIVMPARRRLYLLRSGEWVPMPGSGSFPCLKPHECVRGGCLNVRSGVRGFRHQPIDRGHRHRRPDRDTNRRCLALRAGLVSGI